MEPTRTHKDPDGSVNYVWQVGDGEALEARMVQRTGDELIVYVSSQTACEMACRMCHLTQSGQVKARDATTIEMVKQVQHVLQNAPGTNLHHININFMARGEPMDNPNVNDTLLDWLSELGSVRTRFKISTIMPKGTDLIRRFGRTQPDIYYSLYSMDRDFRLKWFPRAGGPWHALGELRKWQDYTHKIPRIHFACIKGQNDHESDILGIINAVESVGLRVDWNIVRYNAFSSKTQEGNWQMARNVLRDRGHNVQVVERVGPEVAASCGMFVGKDGSML